MEKKDLFEIYLENWLKQLIIENPSIKIYSYISSTEKQKSNFKSAETLALEKSINERQVKMKQHALDEDFEEAIKLKSKIVALQEELQISLEADKVFEEENKSAKQLLIDLTNKLNAAVKAEDYELAIELRDKIKSIK